MADVGCVLLDHVHDEVANFGWMTVLVDGRSEVSDRVEVGLSAGDLPSP